MSPSVGWFLWFYEKIVHLNLNISCNEKCQLLNIFINKSWISSYKDQILIQAQRQMNKIKCQEFSVLEMGTQRLEKL